MPPVPLIDVKAQYAPLIPELKERFADVLDSAEFIRGPNFYAFEQEAATYLGVPRTATQKVRKGFLTEAVKARMKDASQAAMQTASPLAKIIAEVSGETPTTLNPNANLSTDLKLDSLGRVELLSALEDRYQVEIDEASFTAATTLGDVEQMIREGVSEESVQYPFPRWAHRFPFTWIRFILFYTVVFPLIRLMCPLKIKGRERLRDARGPLLFISNHITMVDHALILAALPARLRHHSLAIAMEGEILRGWLHPPEGTGLFTRIRYRVMYALVVIFFNVFPLPQKSGFRKSFAYAGEMMDRGYSVLVFPEGRRSDDGLMSPFKAGTGLLALKLGAPVVPMRIDGLFELKERNQHFAQYGQVSVNIGEPVQYSQHEEAAQITEDMQRRVANL